MSTKYKQPSLASAVRFEKAPLSGLEFSKMRNNPRVYTTYNAGDIVPVYYEEILPHSTFSVDIDFINRLLSATIRPTMGAMQMDIFAYFVPNRIVNKSWNNVQGENTSGYWNAPEIELAPLYNAQSDPVSVPVGSVADYYGFGTQSPIPSVVLSQCNDLKFRGYLEVYNSYFRDQNYQPPINYSKLNIYNGFFDSGQFVGVQGASSNTSLTISPISATSDGSFPAGAVVKEIYGEGTVSLGTGFSVPARFRNTMWSALSAPLKANKLHDPFTSVLPSPQKGPEVFFGVAESAPVVTKEELTTLTVPLRLGSSSMGAAAQMKTLAVNGLAELHGYTTYYDSVLAGNEVKFNSAVDIDKHNMYVDLTKATGISINDLRKAAAIQQVYEMLGRGGSRYLESLRSFFGIDAENPFKDIPTQLGHIRKELDLYQVAQTSASVQGESAQGSLTGFGYTAKDGKLFTYTALEHGYIHFMLVVRHRNIYPSLMMPDNFRMSTLDWYYPQLANIGEQPVRLATLNPFHAEAMEDTIGFQEAFWEYRFSPDRVSGYCRTGLNDSLDIWTYADDFDSGFTHVNGEWLYSNSQEVLDRTLAVTSELSPQFIIMMEFKITRQIPMPVYSVPGLDIL